jgi:hypothetical protein
MSFSVALAVMKLTILLWIARSHRVPSVMSEKRSHTLLSGPLSVSSVFTQSNSKAEEDVEARGAQL